MQAYTEYYLLCQCSYLHCEKQWVDVSLVYSTWGTVELLGAVIHSTFAACVPELDPGKGGCTEATQIAAPCDPV